MSRSDEKPRTRENQPLGGEELEPLTSRSPSEASPADPLRGEGGGGEMESAEPAPLKRHEGGDAPEIGACARPDLPERGVHRAESGVEDEKAGEDPRAEEMEELRKQLAFYVDQLQRSRAELDNFRRRTVAERGSVERRIGIDIFRRILPLLDDLEMALEAQEGQEETHPLHKGLEMIVDKFERVLAESGIEPIEAVGEPFDPRWQEALFEVESNEVSPGAVAEVLERGYRLGDDLIRPARVKVAKAPAPVVEAKEGEASVETIDTEAADADL
ncbi:MAG: nucleotide exchange factor GrpE [Planctomycetota bacterium]